MLPTGTSARAAMSASEEWVKPGPRATVSAAATSWARLSVRDTTPKLVSQLTFHQRASDPPCRGSDRMATTVLVTGATGFLGSNILTALAALPDVAVVAACRRTARLPAGFDG